MMKMAEKKRKKVISDKLFHELWTTAKAYKDPYHYANEIIRLNNACAKDLKKTSLDADEIYDMAKKIFGMQQMTISQIVVKSGKKKAEISHIFCIPIRTLEDWCAEKAKCPDYVKIMMLKQFHLFRLGKYVCLASEEEYKETKPSIYEHSEAYEINKLYKGSKKKNTDSTKDNRRRTESLQKDDFYIKSHKDTYLHSNKQLEDDMKYVDRLIKKQLEKKKQRNTEI